MEKLFPAYTDETTRRIKSALNRGLAVSALMWVNSYSTAGRAFQSSWRKLVILEKE